MDYRKIEWIFLIAFLGLNMFLFSIYNESQNEESLISRYNQTDSLEKRLANDNISMAKKLSTEKHEGYYLSGEQTDMAVALDAAREEAGGTPLIDAGISVTENTLTSNLRNDSYINVDKVEESLTEFLRKKDRVIFGDEYSYLKNFSNTKEGFQKLVAVQSYEEIPFYDETAKIEVSLESSGELLKISKYSQTHIDEIETLREKMDLYTEYDAINTLYTNNRIPSGAKIKWSQLAYSRILKVREKNVYVPVWFIAIETNEKTLQVESVNAISNTITTNAIVPKIKD
ncbi:hypothetical protein BAU15_02960 [Enterococcus sp. JM4C]|uniref:two-component system regulatory protein YycI n=1 Tax=Candidatus Enterococcus huntleyi TaxID=1857217 RepID=UPI00137B8031|nr:two-component system regulatory protein YycI [Enterococcus sp. JM4C]KAF1299619.1 hypothetical protein BAU15_02960 [Enterococcus sp. JM4C]